MKLVIDIQDDVYRVLKEDIYPIPDTERLALVFKTLVKKGTPLPDHATNGDVIKALFPHISIEDNCQKYYSVDIENLSKDKSFNTVGFRKDWWNAPYKAGDADDRPR